MKNAKSTPLLVREIFVDFTITAHGEENKLRLGGIAHAARGFWALNTPFSAGAVLPCYLEQIAEQYFRALGCVDFHVLGRVRGAPNVIVVFDPTEVSDQKYETLLREEKSVELSTNDLSHIACSDILIFPGSYDMARVCEMLPRGAALHLDVAYDFDAPGMLSELPQAVETIMISTSSPFFKAVGGDSPRRLLSAFEMYRQSTLIFKENRGGTRMFVDDHTKTIELPAQLGSTVNSVGVGDVFAATYVTYSKHGSVEAGWRATYAAAAYSQTTYPDLFKTYVQRDLNLTVADMQQLSGVSLAWEKRQEYPIYLAAPDFSYGERQAIDKAIASLSYHNFIVRRPIVENGEVPVGSTPALLDTTYRADRALLKQCSLVFAVPIGRDPGTLVEIGMAIETGIPVVVYDPDGENANTMVMAGTQHYSAELDSCLNAVFTILAGDRKQ